MRLDILALGEETYDFNSRTHVECDYEEFVDKFKPKISTHALTWSATSLVPSNVPDTRDFNSHTHVECDRFSAKSAVFDGKISTHALTWSATGWVVKPVT